MEITKFDIVDLGVVERDQVAFGASHQYNGDCLGIGDNAQRAFEDALTSLSLEGYDTRAVEHVGREMGWFGQAANIPAADLFDEVDDDDNPVVPTNPQCHVLIRFSDPHFEEENE